MFRAAIFSLSLLTACDAFMAPLAMRPTSLPLAAAGRSSARLSQRSAVTMMAELTKIDLKSKNGHSATIYPFGACVTSYKAPHEVLFVRPDAKLDGSKPISGGIPHCFPQFGPGKIQQHGFARNLVWDVRDVRKDEPDRQSVTLVLRENDETMAMWPHKFEATYTVGLEEDRLDVEFRVKNTDTKPFDFQAAFHTYFAVTDVDKCEVTGKFEGATYLDKMEKPPKEKTETRKALIFDKEVDSVYGGVSGEVVLVDKVNPSQSTTIRNLNGWEDTVLWSPYGNEGMGYKKFVCVESAKAVKPVMLAPGQSWFGTTSIIPGKK